MLLITRSTTAGNDRQSENRSTSARLSNQNGSRFKKRKHRKHIALEQLN
jgi:hypothetical protein